MSALVIRQLRKQYRNGLIALKDINLEVMPGDFFALLGPNGAGKSTTISIITSLVNKTSGSIQIFGHDIDHDLSAAKACIGLVPQEFNFNQFESVEAILMNQAGFYGVPSSLAHQRTEKYLRALGLRDKRKEISRELSGGMKRRLMIARALMHEPRLLILDEPTAGVDIELRRSMWTFLRDINAQGTTIILTTHYLEEAENLCRNIAIIDKGKIIENTSMKALLNKLCLETFIFDTDAMLPQQINLAGYVCRRIDDTTLEVDVDKIQTLNQVFAALSAQHINILSMRNKSNRLEELFVHLLQKETGIVTEVATNE